jgi:hypothetical protein
MVIPGINWSMGRTWGKVISSKAAPSFCRRPTSPRNPSPKRLAPCDLPGFARDLRIVDFRRVYSLPLAFVRQRVAMAGDRLRLLPPYREHLSQAFARFFMRVGLPVDIPPFR